MQQQRCRNAMLNLVDGGNEQYLFLEQCIQSVHDCNPFPFQRYKKSSVSQMSGRKKSYCTGYADPQSIIPLFFLGLWDQN